jgi:hypothetical protein
LRSQSVHIHQVLRRSPPHPLLALHLSLNCDHLGGPK